MIFVFEAEGRGKKARVFTWPWWVITAITGLWSRPHACEDTGPRSHAGRELQPWPSETRCSGGQKRGRKNKSDKAASEGSPREMPMIQGRPGGREASHGATTELGFEGQVGASEEKRGGRAFQTEGNTQGKVQRHEMGL